MKALLKWFTVFAATYVLTCLYLTPSLDGEFLQQDKCPACYGLSFCSNLTSPDNEVILINHKWNILNLLNVRNVYFGSFNSHPVVFKKLGHNWELDHFDSHVCSIYSDLSGQDISLPCASGRALQKILSRYGWSVVKVTSNHPDLFESNDALKCIAGHHHIVDWLLLKFSGGDPSHEAKENFVTLLAINPEPVILKAFGESEASLPPMLGACGRVIVEQYVGTPLSHFANSPWTRRANYTVQLLQLARRLSDATLRLYLTDPSPDNFVVDKRDKVWLADAENVVLVDSETPLLDSREHVNDGLGCKDCLSFAYEDLCKHRSADHNFFAICKSLLSSAPFESSLPGGLLARPPAWVTEAAPALFELVELCSYPHHTVPYTTFSPREDHESLKNDEVDEMATLPNGDASRERVILDGAQLEAIHSRRKAADMLEAVLDQLIREAPIRSNPPDRGVTPSNEL